MNYGKNLAIKQSISRSERCDTDPWAFYMTTQGPSALEFWGIIILGAVHKLRHTGGRGMTSNEEGCTKMHDKGGRNSIMSYFMDGLY